MRPRAWLGPTFISITGISLCCWIWGRTGEILQDFGHDLYVAWQVSSGQVIYRDVASIYGPLSPLLNAIPMRLFGPGLGTILFANLIILILATVLLYRLLLAISDALVATIGSIFFLCVFGLSAATRITNYNFLTPYSHQITHGFVLCLGIICCIDWFHRRGSKKAIIFAGLLNGLAFLTKPEIFLGSAAVYFLGVAGAIWVGRREKMARFLTVAIVATLIPPITVFLIFASLMPLRTALDGVLGGWQYIHEPFVLSTPFYMGSMGMDQPRANSLIMIEWAGIYAVVIGLLILLAHALSPWAGHRPWQKLVHGFAIAALAYFLVLRSGTYFASFWPDAARGFPVFAIFAVVITSIRLFKSRKNQVPGRANLLQWCLAIWSLAFLAKIMLFARMYQYGFVLCAPCAMLAIVALIGWLPGWVQSRGKPGAIIQWGAAGIIAAFIAHNLILTQKILSERTLQIPLALGGTAWTRPTNVAAINAIRWLAKAPATIAVIPDAAGINYAAGQASSVPYTEMNPMALAMYGEPNVVMALDQHPPEFVVVVDTSESFIGADAFGRDYGVQLSTWIAQHYRPCAVFAGGEHPVKVWQILKPPGAAQR